MTKKLLESRITKLEKRMKEQDEEIAILKKKDKRKSFWLFWLLSGDDKKD